MDKEIGNGHGSPPQRHRCGLNTRHWSRASRIWPRRAPGSASCRRHSRSGKSFYPRSWLQAFFGVLRSAPRPSGFALCRPSKPWFHGRKKSMQNENGKLDIEIAPRSYIGRRSLFRLGSTMWTERGHRQPWRVAHASPWKPKAAVLPNTFRFFTNDII